MVNKVFKGRKGVFYTVTALLLLTVFLFSFLSIIRYKYSTKILVVETRISSLNEFIKDVERDIQRAVYITSFRTIVSMTQVITTNQTYIDDVDMRFNELFFNGTYENEIIVFMGNNSFSDWEQRISQEAAELDIEISFVNGSVIVEQEDPWHVKTKLNLTLIVGDIKGTANFTKGYEITSDVPIEFFEDPIYRMNTNGLVFKAITIQNNTNFVNGNDTTNLQTHVNETRYIAFNQAPSYLKRLEGDYSSDENGIESLVNKDELNLYIPINETISSVDYIYWGNGLKGGKIQGMPDTFRMDNKTNGSIGHLELYQVEGIVE